MNRIICDGNEFIVGYHTQEYRATSQPLTAPIKCLDKNAWLGIGYYFWTEIEFAKCWGEDFKVKNTGYYDVYIAHLNCNKCLNSVFDEKGYTFLREKIEETLNYFRSRNIAITIEKVNRFLADNIWKDIGIEGIIYDDKPINPRKSNRIYSDIPDLYYKKRIQIVIFNLKNIHKFELLLEEQK